MQMTVLQGQLHTYQDPIMGSIFWYKAKTGEIRFDLPKVTLQNLELKARKYQALNPLYIETMSLNDQIIKSNLYIQKEFLKMQQTFLVVRNENYFINKNNKILLKENEKLKKENIKLKKKYKSAKNTRDISLTYLGIIVTVLILSKMR